MKRSEKEESLEKLIEKAEKEEWSSEPYRRKKKKKTVKKTKGGYWLAIFVASGLFYAFSLTPLRIWLATIILGNFFLLFSPAKKTANVITLCQNFTGIYFFFSLYPGLPLPMRLGLLIVVVYLGAEALIDLLEIIFGREKHESV